MYSILYLFKVLKGLGETMLCNLHTHTVFCDGDNTPEEMVISAINNGFSTLGFSGHVKPSFDTFGITDMKGYIKTINNLKEKYGNDIEIYLGIEDEALSPIDNRSEFEYIIGSHHYIKFYDKILPLDLSFEGYEKALALFDNNIAKFSESYYSQFCDYILKFKPQIIGHFDLITKFDEQDSYLLSSSDEYNKIAEKYLKIALKSGSFFEVNTGAMSRKYRTSPYPAENLLKIIKDNDGKIIITSDAHSKDTLDFAFKETENYLKDIGFKYTYVLHNNNFVKQEIK